MTRDEQRQKGIELVKRWIEFEVDSTGRSAKPRGGEPAAMVFNPMLKEAAEVIEHEFTHYRAIGEDGTYLRRLLIEVWHNGKQPAELALFRPAAPLIDMGSPKVMEAYSMAERASQTIWTEAARRLMLEPAHLILFGLAAFYDRVAERWLREIEAPRQQRLAMLKSQMEAVLRGQMEPSETKTGDELVAAYTHEILALEAARGPGAASLISHSAQGDGE